jgi:hypothetical protein
VYQPAAAARLAAAAHRVILLLLLFIIFLILIFLLLFLLCSPAGQRREVDRVCQFDPSATCFQFAKAVACRVAWGRLLAGARRRMRALSVTRPKPSWAASAATCSTGLCRRAATEQAEEERLNRRRLLPVRSRLSQPPIFSTRDFAGSSCIERPLVSFKALFGVRRALGRQARQVVRPGINLPRSK